MSNLFYYFNQNVLLLSMEISTSDLKIMCRICLGEYGENTMRSLFTEDVHVDTDAAHTEDESTSNNFLNSKIEDCCGIKIRKSFNLPSKICERCCEFVRMWFNFRQMCLNSQVYLESTCLPGDKPEELIDASDSDYMEYLYETLQLQSVNRYNTEEELHSVESTELEGNYVVDYDDVDILAETMPTVSEQETAEKHELPEIISELEPYETDEVEPIEVEQSLIYAEESQAAEDSLNLDVKNCVIDFSVDPEDFLSPTPSPDPKPSSTIKRKPGRPRKPDNELKAKRMVKTETEEFAAKYVCNLCGNVYQKRASFTAHMMAHTDYKPHQCEICSKSFRQMGELRAHIRRHTGERPYKCLYCERHFYDRSEKVRHERVHTNTRPYECKECGKTFTHTAILKNHSLVHSGQKNFSCSICSKSFTLLHQLKAHLQTLTHRCREEQATTGKASSYMLRLEDLE